MSKKIKGIISFLMVWVFFLPTIIKIEHHHDHEAYHHEAESHFHTCHEECDICTFEFSIFLEERSELISDFPFQPDTYSSLYRAEKNTTHSGYSFQLRAPPKGLS